MYIVVEAFSIKNLTKFVNDKIKYGYVPIGGVSVSDSELNNTGIPKNYLQSMLKVK